VSATWVGDDVSETSMNIQSETGSSLGAWLAAPISDRVSIVPGAHYVQKGVASNVDELNGTVTFEAAYLDMPVLLSVRLTPPQTSTAFSLFAGPSFAFEVGCSGRLSQGAPKILRTASTPTRTTRVGRSTSAAPSARGWAFRSPAGWA
jgi:hypothetical protein